MLHFILFLGVWLLLCASEIATVYFIMPIGNSQELDLAYLSYSFYNYSWLFRIILGGLLLFLSRKYWLASQKKTVKVGIVVLWLLYFGIAYLTSFVMRADKMFYQPQKKELLNAQANQVDLERLIIGVVLNNEARAYPIQLIGYHHQVVDTIANEPLMITYCTVCRTGRVFSSKVNGVNESFRLVGMSNYNAMFEDKQTGSWWRQATGEAIFGPLKGQALAEIPCQQMTLKKWLEKYPQSLILQPDSFFDKEYAGLDNYENGNKEGRLTRLDTASWKAKSWVVGIELESNSIAYDWNLLKKERFIQDTLNGQPLLLVLGQDNESFYAWNRLSKTVLLNFAWDSTNTTLIDTNTNSTWNEQGTCIAGEFIGTQLTPIQAYQEYWHSWQTFHPQTKRR